MLKKFKLLISIAFFAVVIARIDCKDLNSEKNMSPSEHDSYNSLEPLQEYRLRKKRAQRKFKPIFRNGYFLDFNIDLFRTMVSIT